MDKTLLILKSKDTGYSFYSVPVPVTPESMFSMQKRLNEMWNKTHIIQCQECVFSPTPWSSSKVNAFYTPSDAPILVFLGFLSCFCVN